MRLLELTTNKIAIYLLFEMYEQTPPTHKTVSGFSL